MPVLIGAAAGAVIMGGMTLFDEVMDKGWGGVDWGHVAKSALVGAISGAVGVATGGAGFMGALQGGFLSGAAEGASSWALGLSDKGFLETVGRSATMGMLFDGVLHGGFAALGKVLGGALRGVQNVRQSLARCTPEPPGLVRRMMQKIAMVEPACFLAGTLVETKDGKRAIERLRVGDEVLSRDEQTARQGYKKVIRLFRGHTDQVVYLRVAELPPARQRGRSEAHQVGDPGGSSTDGDDGSDSEPDVAAPRGEQTIRSTPGHPYHVEGRGFVHAKDLVPGDQLRGSRGEALVVVDLEILAVEADHYNFEVQDWHTYFVAGDPGAESVWVHNRRVPKRILKKRAKAYLGEQRFSELRQLHRQDPTFFPDPARTQFKAVSGPQQVAARARFNASGQAGHHVHPIAHGGPAVPGPGGLAHTGETMVRRDLLAGIDLPCCSRVSTFPG